MDHSTKIKQLVAGFNYLCFLIFATAVLLFVVECFLAPPPILRMFRGKSTKPFYIQSLALITTDVDHVYPSRFFGYRSIPGSSLGKGNVSVAPLPEFFAKEYRPEDLVLHVDKWGFLTTNQEPADPYIKAIGKNKIICLGGSTMAGWGTKPGESIPSQLHTELEKRGIPNLVLNAAMPNYNLAQEAVYYMMELVQLKPDAVVFLDGYNDRYGRIDYMPSLIPPSADSRFISFFRALYPALIGKLETANPPPVMNHAQLLREKYQAGMEDMLRKVAGVSMAYKIKTVLALQPELTTKPERVRTDFEKTVARDVGLQYQASWYLPAKEAYQNVAKDFGKKEGVVTMDLLNAFEMTKENTYFDHIHYDRRGAKILAEKLAGGLASVLPRPSHPATH